VPVRFDNDEESPGLKRGGVLNVVQHELELVCDAASIPNEIHIDLTGLEIGDSIHIGAVTLPQGVTAANKDEDFTVATIVAPSAMKQEEEEAAAAEGEVPTVGEEGEEGAEGEGGEAAEGEKNEE
jgi:large subunit ribosomal protein L25